MDYAVLKKLHKRNKTTKESCMEDIATTISDIAETLDSINNTYSSLLQANKAIVLYCLNVKRRTKELNMGDVTTNSTSKNDSSVQSTLESQ